jgi:hypothetical protein
MVRIISRNGRIGDYPDCGLEVRSEGRILVVYDSDRRVVATSPADQFAEFSGNDKISEIPRAEDPEAIS